MPVPSNTEDPGTPEPAFPGRAPGRAPGGAPGAPSAAPPDGGLAASYRRLSRLEFPARYPLVQFPNPPLLLALLASIVGLFVSGEAQNSVTAVGTIGIVVWAWLEAVEGVNLFRRVLGIVVLVSSVITLADRLG